MTLTLREANHNDTVDDDEAADLAQYDLVEDEHEGTDRLEASKDQHPCPTTHRKKNRK